MDINLDGKRIMHIDTSCKFYQIGTTGIAFKMINTNEHRGLALSNRLKRNLDRCIKTDKDYARLYSICIYELIQDKLENFDVLVICGDENFEDVKKYLGLLFTENNRYNGKSIISIADLRTISGDPNLTSYADNIVNIYRKKALRVEYRRQKGIQLDTITINFKRISEQWNKLSQITNKKGGGV